MSPPNVTVTPATPSAPNGTLFVDPSRDTIFWEAVTDKILSHSPPLPDNESANDTSQNGSEDAKTPKFRRPFEVQWQSTQRIPFYRTRC